MRIKQVTEFAVDDIQASVVLVCGAGPRFSQTHEFMAGSIAQDNNPDVSLLSSIGRAK